MIEINGRQFSGSVVKNDSSELIVTVIAPDTMPDLCLAMTNVKTVTETTQGGSNAISVNMATQINATGNGIYNVTFSKKISAFQEMSNAIDNLLVMMLEGESNV